MKWTKTPPTKTGWYWERCLTVDGNRDRIIHVVKLDNGTCHAVLVAGLKNVEEMSFSFDLQWAGPIPSPNGCASVPEKSQAMDNEKIIYLTEQEVSVRYGIKTSLLRKWRHLRKGIPFVKIGSSVRYRSKDVDEYLTKQVVQIEVK